MLGLYHTDAASSSLLLNLKGLATMAIARLVFRENVDKRVLLRRLLSKTSPDLIFPSSIILRATGGERCASLCLTSGIHRKSCILPTLARP